MLHTSKQNIDRLLIAAILCFLLTGCGVTLSPIKRKPLHITPIQTTFSPNNKTVLVRFESTLPGIPLAETLWDNKSGAFADAEESMQIGFTQDYSKLVPAAAAGGIIGGAVVGTQASYTRIFIPFGRIFEGVFQSGLQKAFPNSKACSDDSCESEIINSASPTNIIRLNVIEFQVWEKPLNHLNMNSLVKCKVYRGNTTSEPDFVFETRHQTNNQSLGSIMSTSSGFIKEMNRISNEFAASLSEEVLNSLHQKLSN